MGFQFPGGDFYQAVSNRFNEVGGNRLRELSNYVLILRLIFFQ